MLAGAERLPISRHSGILVREPNPQGQRVAVGCFRILVSAQRGVHDAQSAIADRLALAKVGHPGQGAGQLAPIRQRVFIRLLRCPRSPRIAQEICQAVAAARQSVPKSRHARIVLDQAHEKFQGLAIVLFRLVGPSKRLINHAQIAKRACQAVTISGRERAFGNQIGKQTVRCPIIFRCFDELSALAPQVGAVVVKVGQLVACLLLVRGVGD